MNKPLTEVVTQQKWQPVCLFPVDELPVVVELVCLKSLASPNRSRRPYLGNFIDFSLLYKSVFHLSLVFPVKCEVSRCLYQILLWVADCFLIPHGALEGTRVDFIYRQRRAGVSAERFRGLSVIFIAICVLECASGVCAAQKDKARKFKNL